MWLFQDFSTSPILKDVSHPQPTAQPLLPCNVILHTFLTGLLACTRLLRVGVESSRLSID